MHTHAHRCLQGFCRYSKNLTAALAPGIYEAGPSGWWEGEVAGQGTCSKTSQVESVQELSKPWGLVEDRAESFSPGPGDGKRGGGSLREVQ